MPTSAEMKEADYLRKTFGVRKEDYFAAPAEVRKVISKMKFKIDQLEGRAPKSGESISGAPPEVKGEFDPNTGAPINA